MGRRIFLSIVIVCTARAAWAPPPAAADDWPTWRHDLMRSAVTAEKFSLPLEQVWAFRSRQAKDAPVPAFDGKALAYPWGMHYTLPISSAGDLVFFNSAIDNRTVCLDAATGRQRWQFTAAAAMNRTPSYYEGRVYVGSDDGHVYCLDAKTGEQLWKFKAVPHDRWLISYGRLVSVWPVRSDVVVDGGIAYFTAGILPHEGTFLFAIDAKTGKQLWCNASQGAQMRRDAIAPAGHLIISTKTIWVPRDHLGYSQGHGMLISFERDGGRHPVKVKDPDAIPWQGDPPVYGAVVGATRYLGDMAQAAKHEHNKPATVVWDKRVKKDAEYWTDVDSVLGMRLGSSKYRVGGVYFRNDPDACTVVYAGGVVYHSTFQIDPKKGVGSKVVARSPADGNVLWSTDVSERVNQLVVANGRLFAATRRGTIYCFAAPGAAKHGTRTEAVGDAPIAEAKTFQPIAASIVKQSNIHEGYALVLDCDSGALAYQLARQTKLSICAVFDDEAKAGAARTAYLQANLNGTRITVYHQSPNTRLPFPSFYADLIVSEGAARGKLPAKETVEDLSRILKPIRGVALIGGGKAGVRALRAWRRATRRDDWQMVDADGASWTKRVRPALADSGSWTHQLGDAGHTGSSDDGALKGPLGVLWYGDPVLPYGNNSVPARVAHGLLVLPVHDGIIGCDQYTGRKLWHYACPENSRFVIAGKTIYLRRDFFKGKHRTGKWQWERIALETGKLAGVVKAPAGMELGRIDQMAASDDGKTAYGQAYWRKVTKEGDKEKAEEFRCIFAVDSASGEMLWKLGGPGQARQWGGWMAISDGRLYCSTPLTDAYRKKATDEMKTYFERHSPERLKDFDPGKRTVQGMAAVDGRTGKVLYETGVDFTNVSFYTGRRGVHYDPSVFHFTMASDNTIVFATQSGADKFWRQWPSGRYKERALTVYDGATGKLLWSRYANYRARPLIANGVIYAEPWGYDIRTGQRRQREHPVTGQPVDWAFCRYEKQCGQSAASRYFIFGRSTGVGYHDLLNDNGLYTFYHSRMSCLFDAVSGGGMMIKPPMAIYCGCSWSMPFSVAMGQVSTPPGTGFMFAQPGPTLPVKHLYLDLGSGGDRRDKKGNVWLTTHRPHRHKLLLSNTVNIAMYPGGESVQHSSIHTPIEGADAPFVFASAARGLKRCVIPVTTPADGAGTFTAKLGFAAPPGDKPGQRVFDVKLNGNVVLKGFDIVKEAGAANRAVWKTFTVDIGGDLVLDLVASSDTPSVSEMPFINGIIVLRKQVKTLGFLAPEDVWLNVAKREKTVELKLANFQAKSFRGRIALKAPDGIEVTAPGGQALEIPAGERKVISVNIKASDLVKAGRHVIGVSVVGEHGKVVLTRTLPVDCLGTLSRKIIRGGGETAFGPKLREEFARNVKPNNSHWERLHVSQGAPGGDGAASYLSFHIPAEPKGMRTGSIRSARVRLYFASAHWGMQQAVTGDTTLRKDIAWGRLKQGHGVQWPELNKCTYPDNLPGTKPESSLLAMAQGSEIIVEAPVPGDIRVDDKQPNILVAVEPTGPGGPVYWGNQAPDPSMRPALVIDYEPAKK